MIALWLEDGEPRLVENLPVPSPPANEALIRVLQAGICNTDLELVRGYYPFNGILGHEFVGIVESAPAQSAHLRGRRVVGEINAVCGDCSACRAGRSSHCENRTVLGIVGRHGAFAEYLTLPTRNLHVVPDSVSDEAAVFTEPLAAALRVQQQVAVTGADRVVVVGDGKLGQLIARTLALAGCSVCVVGRHPHKLAPLADFGIDTRPAGRDERAGGDPAVTPGGFDLAVECTGNAAGFDVARRALRPLGTLVLKSTYADRLTLDASSLVVDEITVVGSRCGPFAPALELLDAGTLAVESLVTQSYPLSEALAALEHAGRAGTLKVLLRMP